MVLVLGKTTRFDADWVPFEISYAVDTCRIPIIATYPAYEWIRAPWLLKSEWPAALAERIQSETAHVIHVPLGRQFSSMQLASSITTRSRPEGPGLLFRQGVLCLRDQGDMTSDKLSLLHEHYRDTCAILQSQRRARDRYFYLVVFVLAVALFDWATPEGFAAAVGDVLRARLQIAQPRTLPT